MILRDLGNVCITGNRCRETRLFQIALMGRGKFTEWGGMENFAGEWIFLFGGRNLTRGDSNHSILFQSEKQHSVNIQHRLKSKLAWHQLDKEYEVKRKMVQEQWLQLKLKFLVGYNMKIVI